MRRWLINVAKNETILIVAAILALISCFIVPPDADYKSYIHANTISQLICLMIVVCGFQRIGVFRIIGSRLLHHVNTARGLVITLIAMTYFSAMLITNDVALVTFVPFAIAVLIMANMEDKAVLVGALMTIGANVGSKLTPIGNAHNLYLKALTGMPASEMIGIMAPYSATAAAMLQNLNIDLRKFMLFRFCRCCFSGQAAGCRPPPERNAFCCNESCAYRFAPDSWRP